ncbi:YqaA family protein [Chloroflexota bacterium]
MNSDNPVAETAKAKENSVAPANDPKTETPKQGLLSRGRIIRLLAVLAVLAITATLFAFRQEVKGIESYGYLGAFLISLVSSATIILPVPGMILIFAMGAMFNPLLIGLAAGAGSALGEMTGYILGYSGQTVFKDSKTYLRMERWMRQRGTIVIFVLSFVPNTVFDLAGAAAGVLRFPLWKFLLVCFTGKTLRNILVALAGSGGITWLSKFIERFF